MTRRDRTPDASTSIRTTPARGVILGLITLVTAWLVVWTSSFGGVFLFDDIANIVANESVHDVASMEWLTHGRRPVTNLTFALNWEISPAETGSFHAVNIAIHLLAALALFGLVLVSMQSERAGERWRARAALLATAVALLWLVHPLQTQSVTYIVQRAESLAGLWYLLTLLTAAVGIRREESGRGGAGVWYFVAVLACALAMGTKAVAVTAPLAVFVWDAVFGAGSIHGALKRRWTLYVSLALTWAVLVWLGVFGQVLSAEKERTVGFGVEGVGWWSYLLTQTEVLWRYVRLSVWPDRLVLDYAWPYRTGVLGAIVPGAALAALFLASVIGVIRAKWWGFAGAMFFLVLAPTSSVIPIADAAMEHRMYLPLASVIVLFVVGLFWALDRMTGNTPTLIAAPLVAAMALLLGVRTIERNEDYKDPIGLWRDVTLYEPGNARGWNNYGRALMGADVRRAQAAFERSIEEDPNFTLARVNLAAAFIELGEAARARQLRSTEQAQLEANRDEARTHFRSAQEVIERALALDENRADAITKLGIVKFRQGKLEESIATLERALELEPGRYDAEENLRQFRAMLEKRDRAKALADDGKVREGVQEYKEYFSEIPNDLTALLDYGEIAVNSGARSGVVEILQAALEIDPANTRGKLLLTRAQALASGTTVITEDLDEAAPGENDLQASQRWLRLASEYKDAGRLDDAEQAYRTSIEFDPTNVASRYNLGLLLQEREYYDEAVLEYLDMLVFAPSRVDARSNLGVCYTHLREGANAEQAFREALAIDPEHVQSQVNLAILLDTMRRYDEAAAEYERALELAPGHSVATRRLAYIREGLRNGTLPARP